jgi:hypothetical protein
MALVGSHTVKLNVVAIKLDNIICKKFVVEIQLQILVDEPSHAIVSHVELGFPRCVSLAPASQSYVKGWQQSLHSAFDPSVVIVAQPLENIFILNVVSVCLDIAVAKLG